MRIHEFFDISNLFESEEVHEFTSGGAIVKVVDQGTRFLITGLESKARGSGDAKAVMRLALSHLSHANKPVELHAIPDDDTDTDKLIKFYEMFGFRLTGKPWNNMALQS